MRAAAAVLLVACAATLPPTRLEPRGSAELLEPVSSEYIEIRIAVSPDGLTRLWGSTDRPGGPGGWNIWMSKRSGEDWGAPTAVPWNSDANDFDPAFSADGHWVYFFSNRPGGAGGDDIYRVPVTPGGFGAVEHLGPEVNTAGDEWAPSPSPDGKLLLFSSNRPPGKHDLYLARAVGDGFAPAERLPGAVNTDEDEFDATWLSDGSSIVFTRSADVEEKPMMLFLAHRGPDGTYDAGTQLPDAVNEVGGYTLGPAVDFQDPTILYFSGKRSKPSAGKLDVYRIHLFAR